MKQKYIGLYTRRIAVQCQPLMDTSNTKIKVRTSVETGTAGQEWNYKEETLSTSISENSLQSLN